MRFFLALTVLSLMACTKTPKNFVIDDIQTSTADKLYSFDGSERKVEFEALFVSNETSLEDLSEFSLRYEIKRIVPFLYGPLTHRQWAAPQKGEQVEVQVEKAFLKDGKVVVPYIYKGTWLIGKKLLLTNTLEIPFPLSEDLIYESEWQNCTEKEEGHDGWDMLWYFWDPERYGCDHQDGVHYQNLQVKVSPTETQQSILSFPEYKKMIRMEGDQQVLSMTLAFGYVDDANINNPFTDYDYGMREFQKFYRKLQGILLPMGFKETKIYQKDYEGYGDLAIGARFEGMKSGVLVRVNVVTSAGVDQMRLFADSFAKHHEGFFAWFGHSRVGSGFDANQFKMIVNSSPETHSITNDYQLIYWAGCNSYSYYTMPFFDVKALANPADARGTLGLDIISNGLPSLFAFNSDNAEIVFWALLNFETPTSYQAIVNSLEARAQAWGYEVLVNVLGDEDNK